MRSPGRCRWWPSWRHGRRPPRGGTGRRVRGGHLAWRLDGAGRGRGGGGRSPAGGGVHRGVGQGVGVPVAVPGDPGEGHRREAPDQHGGLGGERTQSRVLDLPASAHLLDDQLGVHPRLDPGRAKFGSGGQAGDESPVLGDVVGGGADRLGTFGQHLTGGRVADHGAVASRARVAPGAPVGLDDHRVQAHSPDSFVRTMIRRQSSQRTTSSGAVLAIRARSAPERSSRQPPQRPPRSRAAPSPVDSRILS